MKWIVLLFVTVSGLAYSQNRSLTIGGISLSIGMNSSQVLEAFPQNISVSTQGSLSEVTYIIQQHEAGDAGYKVIGQFSAVDGKITAITKYFGTYSTDNFSQGLADLYNLLSKTGVKKYSAYPDNKSGDVNKFKSIVFNNENTSYYLNVGDYGFSLSESIK